MKDNVKENSKPVIELNEVKAHFYLDEGVLKAVDGVSFYIEKGKTLGLVGESGCGKSVTAQTILRIVPPPGKTEGKILFHQQINGKERIRDLGLLNPSGDEIRSIRGKDITMIFQEPMTSFSPVHTIGNQLIEAIMLHKTEDKKKAVDIAIEMLSRVGISNPRQRINEYPHQLSGGMRQRAMIAMALSCNPSLLIADEPTTALDVTIQAQVLDLMRKLQKEFGMSILYITHNLGVIAEMSDNVAVMYLGQIVEFACADDIFFDPLHPYLEALLRSIPKIGKKSGIRLDSIKGTVPIPLNIGKGCRFYDRCSKAMDICKTNDPPLAEVNPGHSVRCFLYKDRIHD